MMKMLNLSFLIYLLTITSFTLSLNEETDFKFDDKWKSSIKVKHNITRISATNATVNGCGLSHVTDTVGIKIVGGREAAVGEFPWQVLLKITMLIEGQYREVQCGGSLLHETWVLTAAHCVSDERNGEPTAQQIQISAGIRNRNAAFEPGTTTAQVKSADCVIQHENWRGQEGNFLYDLALIRVPTNNAFRFTYKNGGVVNNICLPPIKNPPFEYMGSARISGWGLTRDGGTPSDVLKYTDVSILNNKVCQKYPYPVPIAPSMICQGIDRTSPCQGDSGGPLIVHLDGKQPAVQIGIVSFGPGQCANSEIPNAIYTKVSYYRNWIDSTIQEYSGNANCGARALKML